MKYDIQFTNQFKKDLKLAKTQNKNLDRLFEVIGILANGGTLDAKYRDHDLTGNNDNRPETLLAVVDAAAAERVVRLASPVIQEERPFQLFCFAHARHICTPFPNYNSFLCCAFSISHTSAIRSFSSATSAS